MAVSAGFFHAASALLLWHLASAAPRPATGLAATEPSPGCAVDKPAEREGSLTRRQLNVADFEPVLREYWVQLPAQSAGEARRSRPAPLLVGLHGQTDQANSFATDHNFTLVGASHGLIAVFPQGMDDHMPGEDQGTGWNIGSAGHLGNATCLPEGVGSNYGCYRSCRKLNQCGRCNWMTCYNDVLFIKEMLAAVAREFCIDLNRVYVQGESNGGMLLQHLLRDLPSTFAAASPWYGTPYLGFLLGSRLQLVTPEATLPQTAIISLHGRNDTTVPPQGGVSDGGWLFEPLDQAVGIWAAFHQCDHAPTYIKTRWDGGVKRFECLEYLNCRTKGRVMSCMYDGVHGDWPTGKDGDEITLWFLLQFSRGRHPDARLGDALTV